MTGPSRVHTLQLICESSGVTITARVEPAKAELPAAIVYTLTGGTDTARMVIAHVLKGAYMTLPTGQTLAVVGLSPEPRP